MEIEVEEGRAHVVELEVLNPEGEKVQVRRAHAFN
jgi:hypothetical protein